MAVEPLTRRRVEPPHAPYRRLPAVEAQIAEVLDLPWLELRGRLLIVNRASPGFVREETLVYLCRRAHRAGSRAQLELIYRVLIRRVAGEITVGVQGFGASARRDAADAIRDALFERLVDLTSDCADYFQVVFFQALRMLIYYVMRGQKAVREHAERSVPIFSPEEAAEDREVLPEGEIAARSAFAPPDQATQISENLNLIKDRRHREAFVLRHREGMQVAEVAAHLGVTPKTIFTWLTAAEATLAAAQGGSDDPHS